MKNDTWRTLALPRAPMNDPDTTKTSAAGRSVTRGASTDRKMTNSKTMMKRIEASWISLPYLADCCWAAALVASCPARCICRSAGNGAWARTEFRSMGVVPSPSLNGGRRHEQELGRLVVGRGPEDLGGQRRRHLVQPDQDVLERRSCGSIDAGVGRGRHDGHLAVGVRSDQGSARRAA